MINVINNKINCCGCNACVQICPKQCINIVLDDEGFWYPAVDLSICVDCGLCEKVCPVINRYEEKKEPLKSVACRTSDKDLLEKSSSGGFFSELAQYIISQEGVVFGARFDKNWNVVHDYVETLEGLSVFRGSKYVQSNIGNTYKHVQNFLKEGRLVLFSGTPCQISGLNHFLRCEYDNLITIDFVCHSCPNPTIWDRYLKEISEKNNVSKITNITFRSKKNGWSKYSLEIQGVVDGKEKQILLESQNKNLYLRGFLQDLYTRPSCSQCPARNYTSNSDITMCDFWGMNKYYPELMDEKGMSIVLLNTQKSLKIFDSIKEIFFNFEIPYLQVEPKGLHLTITESVNKHPNREKFYKELLKSKSLLTLIYKNLWYFELKKSIWRGLKYLKLR